MKNIIFNEEICKGCGLCVIACPKKLIELDKNIINEKGYNPASIKDKEACISCGQCAIICPDVVIKIEK